MSAPAPRPVGPAGAGGPSHWQRAELVGTRDETRRARTLVLAVPGWPGHAAGQHVSVRLRAADGYQAQRSYSIASAPEEGERGRVELTVDRLDDGEVSPYLVDELRVGDALQLRGPIGGWFSWRTADGGPLQLVAGGSGLVPLMAMLRHRAAAGSRVPARLLYSVRGADDVLYAEELARLARDDGALAVTYAVTRGEPPAWARYGRRIDAAMLAESSFPAAEQPRIFVCGPTALVERAASAYVALGHAPDRVRTERFGPTGS